MIFIIDTIPMSILGAMSFVSISKDIITKRNGLAIIIFAILKYLKTFNFKTGNKTVLISGR